MNEVFRYDWTIQQDKYGKFELYYKEELVGELRVNVLNAEEITGTELKSIGNQY